MSELLDIVTKTLSEKQAEDMTVIDMKAVNPFTDYFVICTAKNMRHAGTLSDYIKQEAEKNGYELRTVEGDRNSSWILADFNEVVVHIFTPEARKQYRLESLWADQPQHSITEPKAVI
jgi:ribosome-associated protein